MVIKVPTPALGSGGALGSVGVTINPNVPRRNIAPPNLDQTFGDPDADFKSGQRLGAAADVAAEQISAAFERRRVHRENVDLLEHQENVNSAAREFIANATSQLGGNARGITETTAAAMQTLADERLLNVGDLSRSGQLALRQLVVNAQTRVLSAVSTHETTQTTAHELALLNTALASRITAGAAGYSDSDVLHRQATLIAEDAVSIASITASDDEEIRAAAEQIAREATSTMYVQAINRAMGNDNTPKAKELLDEGREMQFLDAGNGDLARAEAAVNARVSGDVGRQEGNALFNEFGADRVV
jgi:hypothetical protein